MSLDNFNSLMQDFYKKQNDFAQQRMAQRQADIVQKKQSLMKPQKNVMLPLIPIKQPKLTLSKSKQKNAFEKAMDAINSPLIGAYKNVLEPVEKKVERFLVNGNDGIIGGQFKKNLDAGKKIGLDAPQFVREASKAPTNNFDKAIDIAGQFAGAAAPIGAAYKATALPAEGLYKALTLGKDLGKAGKYVNAAVKGGAAMGAYGTASEGLDELLHPNDATLGQRAKNVGLDVALGAAGDPAVRLLGAGANKAFEAGLRKFIKGDVPTFSGNVSQEAIQKASPQQRNLLPQIGEARKPEPVNALRYNNPNQPLNEFLGKPQQPDSPMMQMAKKTMYEQRPLPDYSNAKPTIEQPSNVNVYGVEMPKGDLIDTAPPEYWQKRYEEFAKFVQDNGYNENNLSHEAINELWSHFAKPDEPPLNTVVDLAYTGYKQPNTVNATDVWDRMGNRPPVSQNAKKIMGLDRNGEPNLLPKPIQKPKPSVPEPLPELTIKRTIYKPPQQVETPVNTNTAERPTKDIISKHLNPDGSFKQLSAEELNSMPIEERLQFQRERQKILNAQQQKQPMNVSGAPVNAPQVPKQQGERSFYSTVQNPDKLSPELKQRLEEFDKTYQPMTNQELVDYANKYVKNDMEKAYQFVKNAKKFDPRHITVGHRLIDELQKAGDYNKALDVVERLAEQGTKAGQSIQSYSIYNRLTPEGQLLRAQRHVNRINQNIADPAKQVKLSEQNVQDITQTADSIKRFTGQQEQANNVIKIMDNIKKGNQPTDAELDVIRSFVSDAKKFVSDLEPGAPAKAPKPIKDVRTRDKVVDYMDRREQLARERLRKIMNRANSLPVDMFYALADIGASKIAKGTVKLADFTEDMVKEFGEHIRPYMQQIYNKAAETFNLQSESMTQKRLSEVEKIANKALKDKNLDSDQADAIREFARQVGQMSGDARLESSMDLQSILQALERPTFGQRLSAAQTIAQLLNPKTIVRNGIGNEIFYRVEQMNKLLATPIDMVRSKITGGERTITFRAHNQAQYWHNWLTGAKAGWRGVNPMGLTTAYDIGPQSFRSKWNPLTYLEKSLGATLRSFDHAGYMRAYNKTLGEMANLRAINEGLKGQAKKEAIARYIREADENMMQIADQYGKYATFQDNSIAAIGFKKAKNILNFNKDFGFGDLIIKYPKTPGNLVMRALEYSPAGVIRSASMLKNMRVTKSAAATRDFWMSLSRAIMGTGGFSLLGYMLADKGILTSSGNSDYEISNLEKMAGKQANSVNVSALGRFISSGFNLNAAGVQEGDTFVSYDWAQPISIAVALGTGVNQSQKENQGKISLPSGAKGAFDSAANTVINQSVLKGLNDFLANYPGRTTSDRFGDAAKGIAGSFVPTLSNQIRQINDNTARSTYDPNLLGELENRAVNRVPGAEKKLPPSYDTLGNQKQTFQGGSNNLLNVFLNPAFVSKYNPSPEAKFVLDYINQTGDKTVAPRLAPKKLDGTPLSGQQYSELQRIMGQETQKGLKDLIPKLQGSNNAEDTGKQIYKLLNDAGKKGRSEIRKGLVSKEQLDEANRKYGLSEQTIYYRLKKGWTLPKALTTPNN